MCLFHKMVLQPLFLMHLLLPIFLLDIFLQNHIDENWNDYFQFGYEAFGPLLYGFSKPPEPPDPDEIPFNPPDELADLWNAWDQVTPEDKAIIKIIAAKYKGNSDNG